MKKYVEKALRQAGITPDEARKMTRRQLIRIKGLGNAAFDSFANENGDELEQEVLRDYESYGPEDENQEDESYIRVVFKEEEPAGAETLVTPLVVRGEDLPIQIEVWRGSKFLARYYPTEEAAQAALDSEDF